MPLTKGPKKPGPRQVLPTGERGWEGKKKKGWKPGKTGKVFWEMKEKGERATSHPNIGQTNP